MKKTIILALILTGFLLFLGPNLFKVSAITEEELQAQIQQLLQIIQQLQQQLNILIQQNLSSKKVTIVSPQGGATITSSSLPISWTLEGFTGNEGKVRILFYGGGEATSTTGWQLVRDNLPLSSGSYTLDLTTVSISDPSRCKLRIGVYNPSTNNWVTWSQGSYTGQYYVDTSFSVQFITSKKVTIVSPQGGATITSSSLPISWTLEGFTGNEGKVRILFYGGGEATSTTGWQLVRDNLPLSSGSYTLDLTTVSISDPSRCKLRIGVYNPSTNNWVTWSQGSYTGQYYVDTSFSVQFITSSASTPTSCTWCGQSCVRKTANMYCVQVMPPEGAECREINGVCQIVYGATSYLDSLKIQLPQLSDLIKKLSAALVQLGQKSQ